MKTLSKPHLNKWMNDYKEAWETRNPDLAATLFAVDAEYYETPYSPPALGREGVRAFWSNVPLTQSDVHFDYQILFVRDLQGFVYWQAGYARVPSGETVNLNGFMELTFGEDRLCHKLREWWHVQATPYLPGALGY